MAASACTAPLIQQQLGSCSATHCRLADAAPTNQTLITVRWRDGEPEHVVAVSKRPRVPPAQVLMNTSMWLRDGLVRGAPAQREEQPLPGSWIY